MFDLVNELHKIGIKHLDLEPRNIVRDPFGSFSIIDFSQARLHVCPGIRAAGFLVIMIWSDLTRVTAALDEEGSER